MEFHQNEEQTNNDKNGTSSTNIGTDLSYKTKIVWDLALITLIFHLATIYGLYLCFSAHPLTVLWTILIGFLSEIGVTMGAHRLYSHRAFKATFGTRIVILILQTIAGQKSAYMWAKTHRQHHRYSDTDADPHNANRGFFFSHIGWSVSRKHPEVKSRENQIDMSDVEADPVAMFQKNYYLPIYALVAVFIPVWVPMYFWNETFVHAFIIAYVARYTITLNNIYLINSAAHLYGNKPYDRFILPSQSKLVSISAVGEGWHNYHHSFPWDYKAAELGTKYNPTAFIIELLSHFNLTYDLRTTTYEMIKSRSLRTGDGSHPVFGYQSKTGNNEVETGVGS